VIPIGTQLEPRTAGDPVVKVCGIEGSRYNLAPTSFGPVFALTYDELTSAYDATGYTVQIEPLDEAARWRELSKIKFAGLMNEQPRRQRQQEAEPSPEQVFSEAASEAVIAANVAASGKLKRRA
jgi:hypothetical protein